MRWNLENLTEIDTLVQEAKSHRKQAALIISFKEFQTPLQTLWIWKQKRLIRWQLCTNEGTTVKTLNRRWLNRERFEVSFLCHLEPTKRRGECIGKQSYSKSRQRCSWCWLWSILDSTGFFTGGVTKHFVEDRYEISFVIHLETTERRKHDPLVVYLDQYSSLLAVASVQSSGVIIPSS